MDHHSLPIFYNHVPKNVLLIVLSLLWLPFSLAFTAGAAIVKPRRTSGQQKGAGIDNSPQQTILVTGISMTKGLTIARLLAKHTSHRIIAADIEPIPFISPGRYSRSISRFHRIPRPGNDKKGAYVKSLLQIMEAEHVNLWISCSSVSDAIEDGEVMEMAQTRLGNGFQAVQFHSDVVAKLHEKDALTDYIQSLGLNVPESYRCISPEQVAKVLRVCSTGDEERSNGGKKFILKPVGVDDKARAQMMTLLPLTLDADLSRTSSYLSSMNISPDRPFMLQRFIKGPEYCTHSLVVHGQVKAFVACPSSELLMHYEALPLNSSLSIKMLEFTKRVCKAEGSNFTGHLSFDFLVEGQGEDATLYPIECNPRAHTAIVLFANTPGMANAYLSFFDSRYAQEPIITPNKPRHGYYWIGHDLVTFVIIPMLTLLSGRGTIAGVHFGLRIFWDHLVHWQEATFVTWDPWPFFVLYHVYWPVRFCESLVRNHRWSRINVSTTKMFEC